MAAPIRVARRLDLNPAYERGSILIDRTVGAAIMKLISTLLILSAATFASAADQEIEKTWGDWSKICAMQDDTEGKPQRVCQIVQSANQNETGKLIFQTAIGYVADNDKPIMYLTAPLGIFLPRGISVVIDDKPPVTATVQRCDGNGCLGVLALEKDFVAALKTGKEAQVIFAANAQQNVTLPLSLNGIKSAIESL